MKKKIKSTYLRADEIRNELATSIINSHVKLVAMRIANKDVSRVRDVNAIGKVGDGSASDASQKPAILVHDDHGMPFEVANVVLMIEDRNVRWLRHVVGALDVADQVPVLAEDEDGGGDGVHGHDVALAADGQAGHNIDESDGNPTDKMARGTEDLHTRSLVAAIADDKVPGVAEDGHLARVP